MTDEKPESMQDLQSSKVSPWSRCRANLTGDLASLIMATAPIARKRSSVWLAYFRAPEDTCRIKGDFDSMHPITMAWSCSMLLKLYAGMAYFPAMAFLNMLRVFTRPMSFHDTFFMSFLLGIDHALGFCPHRGAPGERAKNTILGGKWQAE